jgi:hypothetical protein
MPRRLWPLLFSVVAMTSCGLLSDFHTDGYRTVDSGSPGCQGAADCDGGEVCCLSTLSPVAATCRPAPCPNITAAPFPVQLCQSSSECVGVDCFEQSCQLGSASMGVSACGVVATCTPIVVLDAGIVFDSAVPPGVDAALPPFDASLGSSD